MATYVALLRGINVGGRIIKMADLQHCFEQLGLASVRTVLQSGNVLFASDVDAASLKAKIEKALTETFDYQAHVQVCSTEILHNVIADYPFDAADRELQNYVIFLENDLARELAAKAVTLDATEKIKLGKAVIYWQVPKGRTLKSTFAKYLTKPKYRDFNTTRNLNTLQKLVRVT